MPRGVGYTVTRSHVACRNRLFIRAWESSTLDPTYGPVIRMPDHAVSIWSNVTNSFNYRRSVLLQQNLQKAQEAFKTKQAVAKFTFTQ